MFQDNSVIENNIVVHFLNRLNLEGHRVRMSQAPKPRGIGFLRNVALDSDDCKYGIRIDDDSWCEPDYFEKLLNVLNKEKTAGCVGGIVPLLGNEKVFRPLENMGWMNEFGDIDETFAVNFYNTFPDKYIPITNLRSSFAYHNERAKEIGGFPIDYDGLAGFREETDFCLRMGEKYQNFFVPQAICWHLQAPSGGTRPMWESGGHWNRLEAETRFRRKFHGILRSR